MKWKLRYKYENKIKQDKRPEFPDSKPMCSNTQHQYKPGFSVKQFTTYSADHGHSPLLGASILSFLIVYATSILAVVLK